MKYLILDDDLDYRQQLCKMLLKQDHCCFECATLNELHIILKNSGGIDRAIIDLNLRGVSGLKSIPLILNQSSQCEIVVLTGFASIQTSVKAIKYGAINYMSKPASMTQILNAFNAHQNINSKIGPISSIDHHEWEHIQATLEQCNFNITKTAQCLGMHRRTLQRKLKKRHYF